MRHGLASAMEETSSVASLFSSNANLRPWCLSCAFTPVLALILQMWMSRAEYKEYGAGLIHKKAP
jgi:actin-related protein